jgi:hypothetical protein
MRRKIRTPLRWRYRVVDDQPMMVATSLITPSKQRQITKKSGEKWILTLHIKYRDGKPCGGYMEME